MLGQVKGSQISNLETISILNSRADSKRSPISYALKHYHCIVWNIATSERMSGRYSKGGIRLWFINYWPLLCSYLWNTDYWGSYFSSTKNNKCHNVKPITSSHIATRVTKINISCNYFMQLLIQPVWSYIKHTV